MFYLLDSCKGNTALIRCTVPGKGDGKHNGSSRRGKQHSAVSMWSPWVKSLNGIRFPG